MIVKTETCDFLFKEIKTGEPFMYKDFIFIKISEKGAVSLGTGAYHDFDEEDPDIHKVDAEVRILHVY